MGMGKEGMRIILWMSFVTEWLITFIYAALALVTFWKISEASYQVRIDDIADSADQLAENFLKDKIMRAPLASCLLSAMLIIGFNLMTCVILIKKSINRGGPGFGYGFMVGFTFVLAFICLLTGLVLEGFRPVIEQKFEQHQITNGNHSITAGVESWSSYSTDTFKATLVLALISFCILFIFCVILIILQAAISDQLGISGKNGVQHKYATADEAPMLADPAATAALEGEYHQQGYSDAPPAYPGQADPNAAAGQNFYQSSFTGGQGEYQQTTEYQPEYEPQYGTTQAPPYQPQDSNYQDGQVQDYQQVEASYGSYGASSQGAPAAPVYQGGFTGGFGAALPAAPPSYPSSVGSGRGQQV